MLGGEQSGHIIFAKHAGTGDGVLTSLKVMQALIDKKTSLSKIVAPFEKYPQLLKSVRVKNKVTALKNEAVQNKIGELTRQLGDRGRILVRASGTEPVIRVMAETQTAQDCVRCVDEVLSVFKEQGLFAE